MSGHSKWSKIKRQKGATDSKRGALFTRLGNQITVAAREGGGNPEMNFKLKLAIDLAKNGNLPKDNIERAIKRGTGELAGERIEEIIYEGFGTDGVAVMVQALTDNRNRTSAAVKHVFTKYGGNLGGPGAVSWMFEKRGILRLDQINAELELKLIDQGYVDANTLCILLSYSGTTEEVLATRSQALKAKAKIFTITNGGTLAKWTKQQRLPHYIFDDSVGNPSQQPRMGLGYTMIGELALFARLGFIKVSDAEIKSIVELLRRKNRSWGMDMPLAKNPAKQLAKKLQNKIVQLVASEHLTGNIHIWANQTNETAKTLSDYRVISELNHHLLEGLKYPIENRKHVHFLFFESDLYDKRNQFRYKVTQKVIIGNKLKYDRVKLRANTRLAQAFELLAFGTYVTFYQGILSNQNPAKIPWVDLFKVELKKRH